MVPVPPASSQPRAQALSWVSCSPSALRAPPPRPTRAWPTRHVTAACPTTASSRRRTAPILSQYRLGQSPSHRWVTPHPSCLRAWPSSVRLSGTRAWRPLAHPVSHPPSDTTICRATLWPRCRNGRSCCASHHHCRAQAVRRPLVWGILVHSQRRAPGMCHVPVSPLMRPSTHRWPRLHWAAPLRPASGSPRGTGAVA